MTMYPSLMPPALPHHLREQLHLAARRAANGVPPPTELVDALREWGWNWDAWNSPVRAPVEWPKRVIQRYKRLIRLVDYVLQAGRLAGLDERPKPTKRHDIVDGDGDGGDDSTSPKMEKFLGAILGIHRPTLGEEGRTLVHHLPGVRESLQVSDSGTKPQLTVWVPTLQKLPNVFLSGLHPGHTLWTGVNVAVHGPYLVHAAEHYGRNVRWNARIEARDMEPASPYALDAMTQYPTKDYVWTIHKWSEWARLVTARSIVVPPCVCGRCIDVDTLARRYLIPPDHVSDLWADIKRMRQKLNQMRQKLNQNAAGEKERT